MRHDRRILARVLVATTAAGWLGLKAPPAAAAETTAPAGPQLLKALRSGGLVILMRHAHAPAEPPAPGRAEPDNVNAERQLDAAGKADAQRFGEALRTLGIPIAAVWSSPTYRARETVRLAGLPLPRLEPALADGGASMQATTTSAADWLRFKLAQPTPAAANVLIVTHLPNIRAAMGDATIDVGDGEALVLRPKAQGFVVEARLRPGDWTSLAKP